MSNVMNIFAGCGMFMDIAEGTAVLNELAEDMIEVQHPDSKRKLNRSRNDVNNRLKRFISRCKLHHMNTGDESWKLLGQKAVQMETELNKTKDALSMLEGIW